VEGEACGGLGPRVLRRVEEPWVEDLSLLASSSGSSLLYDSGVADPSSRGSSPGGWPEEPNLETTEVWRQQALLVAAGRPGRALPALPVPWGGSHRCARRSLAQSDPRSDPSTIHGPTTPTTTTHIIFSPYLGMSRDVYD
jgi:hypothetical protein